jgi:hypothetical protein
MSHLQRKSEVLSAAAELLHENRLFNNAIWQLKKLRVNADYLDESFSMRDSEKSLNLSKNIMLTLQKC